jgi:hypothetical protein
MGYAHDIGSQLAVVNGYTLALTSAAAGFTTASTAAFGDVIDRLGMAGNFQSVKSVVALFNRQVSTSGSGYCTVGLRLEHGDSSNSTSMTAAQTTETTKVIGCTSDAAAANFYTIHSQDIDLASAKRYIRQVVTITKVATSSADTVQAEGVLIFGGAAVNPATT